MTFQRRDIYLKIEPLDALIRVSSSFGQTLQVDWGGPEGDEALLSSVQLSAQCSQFSRRRSSAWANSFSLSVTMV
jgi:hypothetical protein